MFFKGLFLECKQHLLISRTFYYISSFVNLIKQITYVNFQKFYYKSIQCLKFKL